MTDRIAMLKEFLNGNPNDVFTRYGLAMEYSKAGNIETALSEFNALLKIDPDYAAGYFMAAQMLDKQGRGAEAKTFLQNGIAAASRTGNQHAKSEMQAMLDMLD